jgi:hypothetical protein
MRSIEQRVGVDVRPGVEIEPGRFVRTAVAALTICQQEVADHVEADRHAVIVTDREQVVKALGLDGPVRTAEVRKSAARWLPDLAPSELQFDA